ncbi:hypothetical protein HG535_0E02070 [Zygotorulaspora mrakii]|uniref:NAD-dependent epimerase/dehydratase domain-containing protein n=1 Tax=Zygotorulaspora mrakii TaxID=42260 RepID=A0A7H9B3Q7_ZYGMR|nr:uncharacterized protein HG535_0E02070 [Zygotorulaspora mrakii]QLG73123.1 hypothetical protein HG535_0E02070 [Zygotorulaspora mrakii]
MKVFVTGASGFVGTVVVPDLLKSGHEVLGLARSDESAAKIASLGMGVKVVRGELQDLDILKQAAAECDGVIHLGFVHDFSNFESCCRIDRDATEAMLKSLEGSGKSFIYTNGVLGLPAGRLSNEKDQADPNFASMRSGTESIALNYKEKGVKVSSIRLSPTVHGKGDKGFLPALIGIAKSQGKSGYIAGGENVWSAVNRLDVGHLYTLVLEKGTAGSAYHAVAEQGIKTKDIAKAVGEIAAVPIVSVPTEKAGEHFGFLGFLFGRDSPISSELTRKELGWEPTNLGLIADLHENYS